MSVKFLAILPSPAKHLYEETAVLSEKRQKILENLLPEERQVLEDYHVNTELLADHERGYLYVQGGEFGHSALSSQTFLLGAV